LSIAVPLRNVLVLAAFFLEEYLSITSIAPDKAIIAI
jgi:hypothetical protein